MENQKAKGWQVDKVDKVDDDDNISGHLSMVWMAGEKETGPVAAVAGAKDLGLIQYNS